MNHSAHSILNRANFRRLQPKNKVRIKFAWIQILRKIEVTNHRDLLYSSVRCYLTHVKGRGWKLERGEDIVELHGRTGNPRRCPVTFQWARNWANGHATISITRHSPTSTIDFYWRRNKMNTELPPKQKVFAFDDICPWGRQRNFQTLTPDPRFSQVRWIVVRLPIVNNSNAFDYTKFFFLWKSWDAGVYAAWTNTSSDLLWHRHGLKHVYIIAV